jgi:hypothetical protein
VTLHDRYAFLHILNEYDNKIKFYNNVLKSFLSVLGKIYVHVKVADIKTTEKMHLKHVLDLLRNT